MSEKIVRGRVELELPRPETSDDEEEMWSKWEARNRERFGRERMVRDREGLVRRALALGPIGRPEPLERTRRNGGSEPTSPGSSGSISVRGDLDAAAARRRSRSATDETYARLLSRSRRNSERVEEAFRELDRARVDEAIALRDSPLSWANATGRTSSPSSGRKGKGSSPGPRRSAFVSRSPESGATSSRRLFVSLESGESDAADSVARSAGSSSDSGSERGAGGSAIGGFADGAARGPLRRRSRAASVVGFPTTPSLRHSAAKALRARSASPPRRPVSVTDGGSAASAPRAASTRGRAAVSPGSPAESRALALALAENDAVLAAAGYDVPGGPCAGFARVASAFGRHWTAHGEAARARTSRYGGGGAPKRRLFSARATATFRPPRLYTSSRPDERVRSRAATARAWAKQTLTEAVVLHTVGPVHGEPGVARHWDDPARAAAEQAAAKTRSESLLTRGDARLANEAARVAARVAAARAARLVHGDRVPGDVRIEKLLSRSGETAFVTGPSRDGSEDGSDVDEVRAVSVASGSSRSTSPTSSVGGSRDASDDDDDGARTRSRPDDASVRWPSAFEAFRTERAAVDAEASSAERAARPASAWSARSGAIEPPHATDAPIDPTRAFLHSGQGGAGMARGRSVAALEARSDPARGARLRRQLETAAGPAFASARAERAKAAARVGLAQARLRARAAEEADAEARSRAAQRRARRDAAARPFMNPLCGATPLFGVEAGAPVASATKPFGGADPSTRRPASAPALRASGRCSKTPRPAFSASPLAPSTGGGEPRGAGGPLSPNAPVPRTVPAAEAARRAEAEAAFAAAHRRAIAESPRSSVAFGFAGSTPASARGSQTLATPRASSARRRPSSGKRGVRLVRESLDEALERARGG